MKVAANFSAWGDPEMCKAFFQFIGVQIPEGLEGYASYKFFSEHMDNRAPDDPQVTAFLEEWLKDHSGGYCYLQDVPEGLSWSIMLTDGPDYVHTYLEVTQEELLAGLSQEKVNLLRHCQGRIKVKGLFPELDLQHHHED